MMPQAHCPPDWPFAPPPPPWGRGPPPLSPLHTVASRPLCCPQAGLRACQSLSRRPLLQQGGSVSAPSCPPPGAHPAAPASTPSVTKSFFPGDFITFFWNLTGTTL
jgi:hypothetical protein